MSSANFPKLLRVRQTGEAGVNAVSTIVNDGLKWIFRRVNAEHDFGIDGYIDIVTDDGGVTGQSIAVQIKTGKSFFATKTPAGFTFFEENKHLNYYLNLPVPLLVILCDDKARQCYWELFDIRKTEQASNGWKMNISRNNNLSERSKEELLDIVGPAIEHTESIKAHWEITKALAESDFVFYSVARDDIETGNTDHIEDFLQRISLNESLCRKFQGKVEVGISGYDEDSRELFEVPEVVRWYEAADPIFKYWFFFANTLPPASGLASYWACVCRGKRAAEKARSQGMVRVELDKERLLKFLRLNFLRLNELTDRLGMSDDENARISFAVSDALEIPRGGG